MSTKPLARRSANLQSLSCHPPRLLPALLPVLPSAAPAWVTRWRSGHAALRRRAGGAPTGADARAAAWLRGCCSNPAVHGHLLRLLPGCEDAALILPCMGICLDCCRQPRGSMPWSGCVRPCTLQLHLAPYNCALHLAPCTLHLAQFAGSIWRSGPARRGPSSRISTAGGASGRRRSGGCLSSRSRSRSERRSGSDEGTACFWWPAGVD